MVALNAIRASNARLLDLPSGLVALFVGATSGIGESTLKEFCRHANRPRVYFVGRSQDAADRILSHLKTIQPDAEAKFIQKDLSLLKNVDEVCEEIKSKETKLNLLFMTPGTMSLKGRDETTEGLDKKLVTNYYARVRFTQSLLPLLQAASPQLSRVVSVLAPGRESAIHLSDLDLKHHFSLRNAANHAVTMTDFAFEELANQNPTVSFVHAYPGFVRTGYAKETGFAVRIATQAVYLVLTPFVIGIGESGERHLFVATSAAYPARSGNEGGVSLEEDGKAMKGSNGESGSGAYLIGSDCEFKANEKVLTELREEGAAGKIWEHTMMMFASIRK